MGLHFFGGEFIFTAEIIYLQYIISNDCETISRIKKYLNSHFALVM